MSTVRELVEEGTSASRINTSKSSALFTGLFIGQADSLSGGSRHLSGIICFSYCEMGGGKGKGSKGGKGGSKGGSKGGRGGSWYDEGPPESVLRECLPTYNFSITNITEKQ